MNKSLNKGQMRQGDVFVERVDSIPEGLKPKEDRVVAEGEVSGHNHRVYDGDVFVADNGDMYITIEEEGTLEHVIEESRNMADHGIIDLPAGNYKVTIQREYDPYAKLARQVLD